MQGHATTARASGHGIARPRTAPPRILVVDDEPDACEALRQVLECEGYDAVPETSASNALERIAKQDFDLVLTDVAMVEMNGLDLCRHVVEARPGLPVILITGQGNVHTVVEALRIGARDFLTKPVDADAVVGSVARALQHDALRDGNAPRPEANSRCSSGSLAALNCDAFPAGLLESELFGDVRGAFTDARIARKGLLVQANGDTLLVDEIGELPLATQPKLLRELLERTVRPVGGTDEVPFDGRVIAATNRDLEEEVLLKRFRQDLYYRIDVVRITVPPLRERGDDVLLLARHFVERFARSSRKNATLTALVSEKLLAYGWPGNVRELESCIQRAVALARFDQLTVEDLPDKIRYFDVGTEAQKRDQDPDVVSLFELVRRHILGTIKRLGGNKTQAAKRLGIDRRTLYRRLREYELADSN